MGYDEEQDKVIEDLDSHRNSAADNRHCCRGNLQPDALANREKIFVFINNTSMRSEF